jgi:NAD(P)-dependent dehydrogenase (short-subunit alcohol dehydrogenase family)
MWLASWDSRGRLDRSGASGPAIRSWAAAFGTNGIRVNTVAPGPTRTGGGVGALRDGLEQLGSQIPLGRTADPTEIAEAIVFLASPQASYLTGATVAVDGGFTAI